MVPCCKAAHQRMYWHRRRYHSNLCRSVHRGDVWTLRIQSDHLQMTAWTLSLKYPIVGIKPVCLQSEQGLSDLVFSHLWVKLIFFSLSGCKDFCLCSCYWFLLQFLLHPTTYFTRKVEDHPQHWSWSDIQYCWLLDFFIDRSQHEFYCVFSDVLLSFTLY